MRRSWCIVLVAGFLCFLAQTALAGPKELVVATRTVPPFVSSQAGHLSGFSIDLWDAISRKADLTFRYKLEPDVNTLLTDVQAKRADLGIAAISITADRDRVVDFSQPMFDAGLQILVRQGASSENPLITRVKEILGSGILAWIASIFILGLIPAHLVWFAERKNENGLLRKRTYYPGIFEAYWWSLSTLATQAEEMPKSAVSRVIAVVWMFSAVVFIAFFTAQVTTSMTVQQLQGAINGPDDLPGKQVGTVKGSTAETYLRQHGAKVTQFSSVREAVEALDKGNEACVVYDSPVLQYLVAHDGKGHYETVGDVFQREAYGIAFPINSDKRRSVEAALLGLKEDGTYQSIYEKWFGNGK